MNGADILVVEDNPTVQKLLKHHLEKAGYGVSVLSSGGGAADAIKARKPALVILDIMLPEVDGFEICTEVKADPHSRDIPILILSAVTSGLESSDESMQIKSGADGYMSKPFNPEELLENVRKLLKKK